MTISGRAAVAKASSACRSSAALGALSAGTGSRHKRGEGHGEAQRVVTAGRSPDGVRARGLLTNHLPCWNWRAPARHRRRDRDAAGRRRLLRETLQTVSAPWFGRKDGEEVKLLDGAA